MSRRNGDRRLRLVRKRIQRVPLKRFRRANHELESLETEDHWGTAPPLPAEKFFRIQQQQGGQS